MGQVTESFALGENWILRVRIPNSVLKFCWCKGSLTLNGTSLTMNEIKNGVVEFCLIPETQIRTHLATLKTGEAVCLEPDSMAKAVYEILKKFSANNEFINSDLKIKTSET
jgi:riboflavin synthase